MSEIEKLKVSTRVMYDELVKQQANVRILDASSSMLEFNDNSGVSHLLFSTSSDKSSSAGAMIARNKNRGKFIAHSLGIPVPDDLICTTFAEAAAFLKKHSQVVIKPLDNSGGTGITTHITSLHSLRTAFAYATEFGEKVIVQQHVDGSDFRLLVVAGTFRSAVERRPASVVGDGISSLRALIEAENSRDGRSYDYSTNQGCIDMGSAERHLSSKIESVPANNSVTEVVGPANISLGGTAHEATHLVTKAMVRDAEKISRRLGLGICGVDMMWDKTTDNYFFIEVNATPGIDMHNDPFWGTATDAIEHYVTWLLDPLGQMAI
ncbi:MAG TPA: hypothetical protein PLU21_00535 [Candidatus Saccharibacteria bacterium]|nr:hypothetical protein [Candidatus Saccharibacteria bacterium]